MHTHATAGMAVACSHAGLSMSNFYAAQLHDKLAYYDFEGIMVHVDEGPRLLFNPDYGAGQDVFDALTRVIDRLDPSYRT